MSEVLRKEHDGTSRRGGWRPGLAGLAAVSLIAGIAGCGGSGGTSPVNSHGQVTITLSMQNANVKAQDPATYDIVQAFMKTHPKVKVVIQGQPVAQHEQDMEVAAQSGTLPDIFWVYNTLAQPMAQHGDLLDLTPVLQSLHMTADFAPNMLDGFKQGSVQYGLPYQSLVTGFYYNKAIFAKYHLAVPATFDQLVSVVKTLHQHGVVPIAQGSGANSSFSVWAFLTMLDRFGYQGMYKSILAGKSSYQNAQFLKLYTHIQELQKAGAFPSNTSTQSYFQSVQSFLSGKAAMLDSGVWQAGQIQSSSIGKDVGFWWGPTFTDGAGDQHVKMDAPSAPFVVSAKVKDNAKVYSAVKEFIGFYYSSAGQKIMVQNAQIPVTKYPVAADSAKSPVFAAVVQQLDTPGWTSPDAQPDLVVSATTANAMYDSIYGVMEGVYSPSRALQVVQQTIK
jgi:raffinose/stachyose/melibiose transport system substrate-binding protein